jgi:hypothetical protein
LSEELSEDANFVCLCVSTVCFTFWRGNDTPLFILALANVAQELINEKAVDDKKLIILTLFIKIPLPHMIMPSSCTDTQSTAPSRLECAACNRELPNPDNEQVLQLHNCGHHLH